MSISDNPPEESGMEWSGSVQGRAYRAAGSFSPTAGHLSLYAEAEGGGMSRLLGTVTWQDTAAERLELLATLLALVSGELRETLTGQSSPRTRPQEPGLSVEAAAT